MSAAATQSLDRVAWSTPVDLAPRYSASGVLEAHYGSPVITTRNTVVIPVKTGPAGGYRIEGRDGVSGALLWSAITDYVLPPHNWLPSYNLLLTQQGRLYAPGGGGKVLVRNDADAPGGAWSTHVFFGADVYNANPAAFDSTVFINTPLSADDEGNVFFGFHVTGPNPAGLVSGIARLAPDGKGIWVGAAAAAGDPAISKPAMNCKPAIPKGGYRIYIAVNTDATPGVTQRGYLLALTIDTLATHAKCPLREFNSNTLARVSDDSTSSPVIGLNANVFYGVLEGQPGTNNGRGWLLEFDASCNPAGPPGRFGCDVMPSVLPNSAVPSYGSGFVGFLAVTYNNPLGVGTGDGQNRLAILDASGGRLFPDSTYGKKEAITILAPTLDGNTGGRRAWCTSSMAYDPQRNSVLALNDDGILYRWDLTTNALTQSARLNNGVRQGNTPTVVGADGAVYAISNATLYAVRAS